MDNNRIPIRRIGIKTPGNGIRQIDKNTHQADDPPAMIQITKYFFECVRQAAVFGYNEKRFFTEVQIYKHN